LKTAAVQGKVSGRGIHRHIGTVYYYLWVAKSRNSNVKVVEDGGSSMNISMWD
jgi:hypothetical protein